MMIRNLLGIRFGRLVVYRLTSEKRWGVSVWKCICDCGTKKRIVAGSLISGATLSCGCLAREKLIERLKKQKGKARTHGHSVNGKRTRTYRTWESMIRRCTKETADRYEDYGGRGIKVCSRWMRFENFLADMGERPKGKQLDRRCFDGHYRPSNCRWVTPSQNARNRRPASR